METSKYKCDCCGKEFNVPSKGKLLFPKHIISADGDSFIYCSSFCMKNGAKNVVTGKEVEQILKSLGKIQSNSFVDILTAY